MPSLKFRTGRFEVAHPEHPRSARLHFVLTGTSYDPKKYTSAFDGSVGMVMLAIAGAPWPSASGARMSEHVGFGYVLL